MLSCVHNCPGASISAGAGRCRYLPPGGVPRQASAGRRPAGRDRARSSNGVPTRCTALCGPLHARHRRCGQRVSRCPRSTAVSGDLRGVVRSLELESGFRRELGVLGPSCSAESTGTVGRVAGPPACVVVTAHPTRRRGPPQEGADRVGWSSITGGDNRGGREATGLSLRGCSGCPMWKLRYRADRPGSGADQRLAPCCGRFSRRCEIGLIMLPRGVSRP